MTRLSFDGQLSELNQSLIEMGALIETAITLTCKALVTQSVELADEAIRCDREIDDMEKEIEHRCLKLLLQQQPVARDLRMVSAALKMITDMERIGDQASDIAEITISMAGQPYIKKLEHIPAMAQATVRMVTDSIDAFVKKDIQLTRSVIAADTEVDRLFQTVKAELKDLVRHNPDHIEQAIDLLMIAKYFERIGDHAENIAEWVEFSITGKKPVKFWGTPKERREIEEA